MVHESRLGVALGRSGKSVCARGLYLEQAEGTAGIGWGIVVTGAGVSHGAFTEDQRKAGFVARSRSACVSETASPAGSVRPVSPVRTSSGIAATFVEMIAILAAAPAIARIDTSRLPAFRT
jgi:hypothetical protein